MRSINKRLARIFSDMGAFYTYSGEADRFRAIAYEKAARIIGDLEEDVSNLTEKEMEAIEGIGHGIATKIEEYIATGKISKYEELKSKLPLDLISLLSVKGFGPKTLKAIQGALKIKTRAQLVRALKDGRIANLKGFGAKKVENMLKGLELHDAVEKRIPLWDALEMSERIVKDLQKLPEVENIDIAGSIRRRKETIGDLDILLTCRQKDRQRVIDHFIGVEGVKRVLAKGDTKASILIKETDQPTAKKRMIDRQVDLRIVEPEEWGAALVYFTGSKQHNVHIRRIAQDQGLKVNEYGVFKEPQNKRIASRNEEEVYQSLGLQWMPPEIREDSGEVELALKNKIPELVKLKDIKGDLQMHSTWTDGTHSIEDIANYVGKNYKYDYMAITDHSQAVRVAGGIGEKDLLKQIKEIRNINRKLGRQFVKTGVEVDINTDGSLDCSDELLAQLDWVVASIHTNFNRNNTDRLIKACENPYVHVIGHPTGRLLGTRERYEVSMEHLIKAARATGTALEINAQPQRMDLDDRYARMASERGVKLVISTDSHSYDQFDFMQLGVAIARRAWCKKKDILNTRSWADLMEFYRKKRSSKPAMSTV